MKIQEKIKLNKIEVSTFILRIMLGNGLIRRAQIEKKWKKRMSSHFSFLKQHLMLQALQ